MNGLESLNWVLWFAFLFCIWEQSFVHFLITMAVVLAYGQTERWIGNWEKEQK